MYDTANIYKYASLSNENFIDAFSPYISITAERKDQNGEFWINGSLKNYMLTISKTAFFGKGSLAKFSLNNNFKVLGRSETEKAVQEFSDLLHTNMSSFLISRLDIGQNFILDQPVCNYLNYLGQSRYYTRLEMGANGIEYRNNLKSLAFYDKFEEMKANKLQPEFSSENILRYELRIKKRTRKQLKQSDPITLAQIYDQRFYIDFINLWYKEYQQIEKINRMNTTVSHMKAAKPNDIIKLLAAERINEIGLNNVLKLIDEMGRNEQFARPEYISRVKKELKQLANDTVFSEQPELIRELDEDINRVRKYYR